jgi:hypothetical protein
VIRAGVISPGCSTRSGSANRRGLTPRRFAFTMIGLCVFAIASGALLTGKRLDSAKSRPHSAKGRPAIARRDVLSERASQELAAEASRVPAASGAWSRGGLHALTEVVSGQIWRLGSLDTSQRSCLVLIVPEITQEATCWRRTDIARRPVLVYTGERPDRRDPSRSAEYVVYGRVAPAVESLRVRFSDCSTSLVSLATRPLFWTFVPHAKLAQGVSPQTAIAALRGGRIVRRELQPRSAAGRSCTVSTVLDPPS